MICTVFATLPAKFVMSTSVGHSILSGTHVCSGKYIFMNCFMCCISEFFLKSHPSAKMVSLTMSHKTAGFCLNVVGLCTHPTS